MDDIENTKIKVYPKIISNDGTLKFKIREENKNNVPTPPTNIINKVDEEADEHFTLIRTTEEIEDTKCSFFVNWVDNKTESARINSIEYCIVVQIGNEVLLF